MLAALASISEKALASRLTKLAPRMGNGLANMWLMSSQARHLRRTQLEEAQSSYFLRSLSVSNRVRARAARQRAQGAFAQLAGTTRDRAGGHAPHGRRRVPAAWAAQPRKILGNRGRLRAYHA
ncbi:hypothetical protein C6P88_20255 [Burkholderia contaminans]|nr:hypothetical protein C6P88_20255 [Burkholderia contaminans]